MIQFIAVINLSNLPVSNEKCFYLFFILDEFVIS